VTTASRAALALPILLLAFAPASGVRWGDHGHRLVGRAAADAVPDEMPDFFRAAVLQLEYLNPEPDRWRDRTERDLDEALNAARAPEHVIDLEMVPPGALDAPDRFAYADSLAAHGEAGKNAGVLPYQILEMTQRLRVEFRLWRQAPADERAWIEERIINDAGILGHYVADASNPHHTTIHYNGWAGDDGRFATLERGFHGRFESAYVESHITRPMVEAAVTAPVRNVGALRPAIWAYLGQTHALVEPLYELDEREAFGTETTSLDHRDFAVGRLAAGATMLRDLWWTAWVTSASDD